ncbi:MAG TPA: hypothetical protein V6C65_17820, partial [Allocoleopsis sp.]
MPYPVPPPPVPSVVQALPEGFQPDSEITTAIATPFAAQQPEFTHSSTSSSTGTAPTLSSETDAGTDGILAESLGSPIEVGVATSSVSPVSVISPTEPHPTEPQASYFLDWSESDLTKLAQPRLAQQVPLLPDNFAVPNFFSVSTIPASALPELINGSATFLAADESSVVGPRHSSAAVSPVFQSTDQPIAQQSAGDDSASPTQPSSSELVPSAPSGSPPSGSPPSASSSDTESQPSTSGDSTSPSAVPPS